MGTSFPEWRRSTPAADRTVTFVDARRWLVSLERAWDAARLRRAASRTPAHFRIEPYVGHGSAEGVVLRGRVLDDPVPSQAVNGEGVGDAVRRTVRHFLTDELPGVRLRVSVAGVTVDAVTDEEGYFRVRIEPDPTQLTSPWTAGTVELGAA